MTRVPVPIVLIAGFLGAGKTTVVNHILEHAGGMRLAAVVNDFGAINIDAELIADASDGVVSLTNGCICCSLEGDLLRTLAGILRRDPHSTWTLAEQDSTVGEKMKREAAADTGHDGLHGECFALPRPRRARLTKPLRDGRVTVGDGAASFRFALLASGRTRNNSIGCD